MSEGSGRVNVTVGIPAWLYRPLRYIKRRVLPPPPIPNLVGDRAVEWSWIASQLPAGPGSALDFGPGGSYLGLIAALRGFTVTAIDLEPVQWPYLHDQLQFVQGDILHVDLPEHHFDLVINPNPAALDSSEKDVPA